ncbi:hypothetical protein GHT06_018635 [Daphnia sinensis]|uniref:Uncharacterized protein n=1 Tax=Daphnia sinensis TaxID=1820382 RepID=A0AAD5LE82_9CRUS|nr:hypothetical protein GHT06_018635 [Daphnia sinensis]
MPDMNPLFQECDEPGTTEHAFLQCTALEMGRLELIQTKASNESQQIWRPLSTPQRHEQKN